MYWPATEPASGQPARPRQIDAPEIFVRWKHLVAVLVASFGVNWAATMAYIELRVSPVEQAMGEAVTELKETRRALVGLTTQLAVLAERDGRSGGNGR